jgi:hypothetical protein
MGGFRIVLLAAMLAPGVVAAQEMVVHKSPDCGCCGAWADAMAAEGFGVRIQHADWGALDALKARLGVAPEHAGCHTAVVEGYVVEGHVPAADIRRMLDARPDAVGLAVPGMPVGSPGMEMGGRVDPYDVLLVTESGEAEVFARHD